MWGHREGKTERVKALWRADGWTILDARNALARSTKEPAVRQGKVRKAAARVMEAQRLK